MIDFAIRDDDPKYGKETTLFSILLVNKTLKGNDCLFNFSFGVLSLILSLFFRKRKKKW